MDLHKPVDPNKVSFKYFVYELFLVFFLFLIFVIILVIYLGVPKSIFCMKANTKPQLNVKLALNV